MTSLIIPSGGLFRHNEILFWQLSQVKDSIPFELIIPSHRGEYDRLKWHLQDKLGLNACFVDVPEPWGIGKALALALKRCLGDQVVVLHDDIETDNIGLLLSELSREGGLRVPMVEGSDNPDQRSGSATTTHYIDRCAFGIQRSILDSIGGFCDGYTVDGYAADVQFQVARSGLPAIVSQSAQIRHPGGSMSHDVFGLQRLYEHYRSDMELLSARMRVPFELESRPGLPRIIPAQTDRSPIEIDRSTADDMLNTMDSDEYVFEGKRYRRIRTGCNYSIAPLLERYDAALLRWFGLGDALMATASFRAFKELFPDTAIRVFAKGLTAEIMRHCPEVDKVEEVENFSQVPASAVDWGVANGIEGTPFYGFHALGIEDYSGPRRMSVKFAVPARPQSKRAGIQLHGGWPTKSYAYWLELGAMLRDMGFEVRYYGHSPEKREKALAEGFLAPDTPTISDFAAELAQLSVWVGFDSGGSYLANALGVPSVWLFATHDPAGLIGGCGASGSWEAIWKGMPVTCYEMNGESCRLPVNTGGKCPRRPDGLGADCIDSITVDEIADAALRAMVKDRADV